MQIALIAKEATKNQYKKWLSGHYIYRAKWEVVGILAKNLMFEPSIGMAIFQYNAKISKQLNLSIQSFQYSFAICFLSQFNIIM